MGLLYLYLHVYVYKNCAHVYLCDITKVAEGRLTQPAGRALDTRCRKRNRPPTWSPFTVCVRIIWKYIITETGDCQSTDNKIRLSQLVNESSHAISSRRHTGTKFTLWPANKAQRWELRYISTLSLTSALRGGGWSKPRPGPLYPREWPGTHCIGWVGHGAGLGGCGKCRPHQDSIPGPPSPVASHYPDWAIPAQMLVHYHQNSATSMHDGSSTTSKLTLTLSSTVISGLLNLCYASSWNYNAHFRKSFFHHPRPLDGV
jgi:hypothetical protein